MNMTMLGIVVLATVVFLVFSKKPKKEDLECAKKLVTFLKSSPDANADQIAQFLQQQGRTQEDVKNVTVLVRSRLKGSALNKDKVDEIMVTLRDARTRL